MGLTFKNGTFFMLSNDDIETLLGELNDVEFTASCPESVTEDDYTFTTLNTAEEFTINAKFDAWSWFRLCYNIGELFSGTRMLYLANHAKKYRARKKNRNRIIRIISRYIKEDEQ